MAWPTESRSDIGGERELRYALVGLILGVAMGVAGYWLGWAREYGNWPFPALPPSYPCGEVIGVCRAFVGTPYWYFPTVITLFLGGPLLAAASLVAMAYSFLGRKRTTPRGTPN